VPYRDKWDFTLSPKLGCARPCDCKILSEGKRISRIELFTVPSSEIIAIARDTAKASDLAAKGIVVRQGDYDAPDTFVSALAGIDKLLLISSNAVGKREAQHRALIGDTDRRHNLPGY